MNFQSSNHYKSKIVIPELPRLTGEDGHRDDQVGGDSAQVGKQVHRDINPEAPEHTYSSFTWLRGRRKA